MKKIIIAGITATIFIASCNTNDDFFKNYDQDLKIEFIHEDDHLLKISYDFFVTSKKNCVDKGINMKSKSIKAETVKKQTFERKITVKESSSKSKNNEVVPVHIYNYYYEDDTPAGFVMLMDDERIADKVYAFGFDQEYKELDGDVLGLFYDRLDGHIYNALNGYIIPEPITKSGQSNVYTLTWTNWDQFNSPFCDRTPFCSDGWRANVGCVAVAIGQIMCFHKWPMEGGFMYQANRYYDPAPEYVDYTDWNAVWGKDAKNLTTYGKWHVSTLLAEIAYRLGVMYNSSDPINGNSSYAFSDEAEEVFIKMGFLGGQMQFTSYDFEKVKQQLHNNQPMYADGKSSSGGGHAFNIIGYHVIESDSGLQKYITIHNGRGGSSLGVNYKTDNTSFSDYTYRYNVKVWYNIIKNPFNDGHKDLWQIRPNVFL